MSSLGKIKQSLIVLALLALLVASMRARGETRLDELLVDPTTPLFGLAGAGGNERAIPVDSLLTTFRGYQLSSILIRADSRMAVINNQRVRIGDSIGTARITAIETGSVTLEKIDGTVEVLELYENSIKTLVKGEG